MSRDFTKDVANYMTLANSVSTALNGAAQITFSCWAWFDTITVSSTANNIVAFPNPSSQNGIILNVNGTGGANTLRLQGRPTTTDSNPITSHSIGLTTGAWHQIGFMLDYSADLTYTILNGSVESHSHSGWTATTFSAGSGTSGFNRLGQNGFTVVNLVANNAHDGLLARAAVWTDVLLSNSEWAALGAGVAARRIRRSNLRFDWPIWGIHSGEIELVANATGTITGSLPRGATDPPVQLFSDSFAFDPSWTEFEAATLAPLAAHNLRMMAG